MTFSEKFWRSVLSGICWLAIPIDLHAEELPTGNQFDERLKECALVNAINVKGDVLNSLSAIYGVQRTEGANSFKSAVGFISLLPKETEYVAYVLYKQCVSKIMVGSGDASKETSVRSCLAEADLATIGRLNGI